MSEKLNVLVPDGNSTWALSVIHCLSQIETYKIFVLSRKKRTATKYSKFTTYYKYYPRQITEPWVDIINKEIELNSISIVLPIAEAEISFFIKHQNDISQQAKVIPLPGLTQFDISVNKKSLHEFCELNQIPHPKSYYLTPDGTKVNLNEMNFPILIKPLDLKGGDGIERVDSAPQLRKKLRGHKDSYFIQEYIKGYDIDCSVICLNGDIVTHTIQKGNLKGNNAYAPQLSFEFLNNDEVLEIARDVMAKLNWSGVAHLDLRYDEQASSYKLIEINPRFWGSIEGSLNAGVNFPDLAIQLALQQTIGCKAFDHVQYMRLKGVIKTILRRPHFLFKYKFLMNHTELKSFLKDPLPTFYKFREWLGRKF
ncbi:ATP-grasp domain-containing protein [Formosa sp. Hel1_31_208]|uniref:ATP-grasp domain-containing protein n=1 Tax=Formosa sp. Hel1_31_208 TaxID=1798225 RepID=UPI00087D73C5|nr:ATP-grasp domain-containing protein [Formosa sp. Hel1_31_208]SDS70694.1 ATP-grasp domain-containing protein [Formosa sp. Hel1_31_208]